MSVARKRRTTMSCLSNAAILRHVPCRRAVLLNAHERRSEAMHYPAPRIQSQPLAVCICCRRAQSSCAQVSVAQKRCILTSCVFNRSHRAARLCFRRAVLLSARERRLKATHYNELGVRMQPSCGMHLLPPRTVSLSACERRSKALHYHELRIQSHSHTCGTPLLPPRTQCS